MRPDRWKTIEETFHAAMERPPQDRPAYLDTVCAGDPELRLEVESLLSETPAENFMEQPAGGLSLASLDLSKEPSLEGRVLNHYNIGPLVGAGGQGQVYRARDTRLQRDIAIKVLHDAPFLDREGLESMYREARLLASLNHPNIAAIYGIEEGDGLCALVLELVEGEVLSERIRRGLLSIGEATEIATQIAAGLQAAHAKGVIHRDLKPSNIKIPPDGAVKIVDFGIAKLLNTLNTEEAVTATSTNAQVKGTVAYMSPEQARGKSVDARTDIWAFGCVLYEMLAGKIASEEPDWNRILGLSGAAATEVERLIRKCMQKTVAFRYQSVSEISADLAIIRQMMKGFEEYSSPQKPISDDDFVLPGRAAPSVFLITQLGYLALYGAAMYHIDAIARILATDFMIPERASLLGTMFLAMCGIAVRVYLISSVGWRHPAAGRNFRLLFPVLLPLDSIWAASPLLLWRHVGYGLGLVFVALLAYVPFAERTLMRTIYPRRILKIQTTR
jgi:hypothetical protein